MVSSPPPHPGIRHFLQEAEAPRQLRRPLSTFLPSHLSQAVGPTWESLGCLAPCTEGGLHPLLVPGAGLGLVFSLFVFDVPSETA